ESAFVLVMGLGGVTALVALAITAFIPPRKAPEETAPAVPSPSLSSPSAGPVQAGPGPRPAAAAAPSETVRPLVAGTVRRGGVPVVGAVLTVVDTAGSELGRARSGEEGRFAVTRSGPGRSRLLVVQSPGAAHAEFLTDGAEHVDLELDRLAGTAVRAGHDGADLVR
ncbi:MAG: hypothetical protein ABW212_21635, partial [Pseudonocardia sediminis]